MAKKSKANYGDGTIFYSNSKGKWMGQINTGRDENGKIKRKSVYGDTQQISCFQRKITEHPSPLLMKNAPFI